MAINSLNEINRTPGFSVYAVNGVNTPEIVAGNPIRLVDASTVTIADGSAAAASYSVYGIAAESTAVYAASQYGTILDSFAKNGKVSAYINGGVFEVWNDGRGAVFASDCIGAVVGSLLYVDSDGLYTTTAGSAGTVGEVAMGILVSAPTSSTGVLKFQFNM